MTTTRTLTATINTNYAAHTAGANWADLDALPRDEAMDAYLADFDDRHADDAPTSLIPAPDAAEVRGQGVDRLIAARIAADATRPAPSPLRAAYMRYIDDGIADTDGTFIPLPFDAWKASRTITLPPTPAFDTLNGKGRPQHLTRRTGFKGYGY